MTIAGYGTPHDTNPDKGYGRNTNRLHNPRQARRVYPYIEEDNVEEYEDKDTSKAISKKIYIM